MVYNKFLSSVRHFIHTNVNKIIIKKTINFRCNKCDKMKKYKILKLWFISIICQQVHFNTKTFFFLFVYRIWPKFSLLAKYFQTEIFKLIHIILLNILDILWIITSRKIMWGKSKFDLRRVAKPEKYIKTENWIRQRTNLKAYHFHFFVKVKYWEYLILLITLIMIKLLLQF